MIMEFPGFLDFSIDRALAMVATYDPILVMLSFLIASLGSYTALGVAERVEAAARTVDRWTWLAVGSLAMGGGVWAMHFIGMLAFRLPIPVNYDLPTTVFSMVPAILAGAVVLRFISPSKEEKPRLVIGGVLMGAGIGIMHYSGMAAMRMDAFIRYDPVLFTVSIIVAVGLAIAALYMKFWLGGRTARGGQLMAIASALVMGLAVAGTHYTAMRSAYCFVKPGATTIAKGLSPDLLGTAVGAATLLIILLSIIAVAVGRRLESAASSARSSRNLLVDAIESISDGFVLFDANDRFVMCNSHYRKDMAEVDHLLVPGTPFERIARASAESGPNDPGAADMQSWLATRFEHHRRPGESFEQRQKSGRWMLISEHRTHDGGTLIVRTDITARKRAEKALRKANEHLELQVARRTENLTREIAERQQAERALRRSERRFRNLVGGSIQGILIHVDRRPFYVNQAWAEIHGFTVDEVLAMETVAPLISERDKVRMAEYRTRRLRGEETPTQYEYEAIRKDGSRIWLENRTNVTTWNDEPAILSTVVDITERKRVEQALSASEERFRGAIENLQEGFALYDADDRLVLCNDEYRRLHPRTEDILKPGMSFETLIRANIARGVNADAVGNEEEHIRDRLERHRNPRGPIVRHITDGSWFIIKENRTPDGGVVVTETDITELKRAEANLRDSENRIKDIAEAASDYFWELDENFRFSFVSARDDAVPGYTPDALVGRTRWDVVGVDPDQDEMWRDHRATMEAHEPFRDFQYEYTDPQGQTHYWSVSGNPVFDGDGNFKGYRGAATLITERMRAQAALRESEEKLRTIIDNSPTKIHIKDLDGRYLLINRQSEVLFGVTDAEARGKVSHDIFPKGVADSFKGHDQRVIDTRQTMEEEEEWPFEGGIRTYLTVKFPILGASGDVVAVGAIGTDITERKKAEAEVRHLNTTLEERVARRTADLEAANKELEAFSYSVSHDLRGPLRTVDGFSRILLEEYSDKLDDQARGYLGRVRAGSQKMGQLIDAILMLSRLTRNELNCIKFDISGVVNAIVTDLKEANSGRDLTFEVSPGVTAVGDEELLRVALENLLGNAVKYTGKKMSAKIEFGATNGDGRVVYYVRDNGAGFDMAYAHKLFAPFQRVHGPKEFEGNGIGLATVKRIINRHSGNVWAEAEVENGATFYFTL